MVACLESLFLVIISNSICSAALLVLEAGENDKDREDAAKNQFFRFRRSYAMEAAH